MANGEGGFTARTNKYSRINIEDLGINYISLNHQLCRELVCSLEINQVLFYEKVSGQVSQEDGLSVVVSDVIKVHAVQKWASMRPNVVGLCALDHVSEPSLQVQELYCRHTG